jgi:hypothetical protein
MVGGGLRGGIHRSGLPDVARGLEDGARGWEERQDAGDEDHPLEPRPAPRTEHRARARDVDRAQPLRVGEIGREDARTMEQTLTADERGLQRLFVADVSGRDLHVGELPAEGRERMLELARSAHEGPNGMAPLEEIRRRMGPDQPARSRHEDPHLQTGSSRNPVQKERGAPKTRSGLHERRWGRRPNTARL